jgi:hypothetical protein
MAKDYLPGDQEYTWTIGERPISADGWNHPLMGTPNSTAQYPTGTALRNSKGDIYRYIHAVAAIGKADIVGQDLSVTSIGPIDGKATAAAVGATEVTLTDTNSFSADDAVNVYAGGTLIIEDDAGEGHKYSILSNAVGTSAGVMVLKLHEAIAVALSTSSDVCIIGSMHRNLRPASTTDSVVSGVAVKAIGAGEHGWIQTWGIGVVIADLVSNGLMVKGAPAFLSDGDVGQAQNFGGVASNTTLNTGDWDTPQIGYFVTAGTDGASVGVYLTIAP